MKKLSSLFLLIVCLLIGGCSEETKSSDITETSIQETSIQETEKIEETRIDSTEMSVKETEAQTTEAVKEQEPVLLYEDDEVEVYYTGLTSEGVTFEVENKTKVNLTVQADSIAINGISTNDIIMSDDVAPYSRGEAIALCNFDVNTEVYSVSGKLRIFDFNDVIKQKEVTFAGVEVSETELETEAIPETREVGYEQSYTHKCESCDKEGIKAVKGLAGNTEWYCQECYDEMMDIIGMMESDVGAGTASKHHCEECSKEGTRSIVGLSGELEYYCTEHYNEMIDILNMMTGK